MVQAHLCSFGNTFTVTAYRGKITELHKLTNVSYSQRSERFVVLTGRRVLLNSVSICSCHAANGNFVAWHWTAHVHRAR